MQHVSTQRGSAKVPLEGASFATLALSLLLGCQGGSVVGNGGGGGIGGLGPLLGGKGGVVGPVSLGGDGTSPPVAVDPGAAPIACSDPKRCADFPANPINDPNSPTPVPSNPKSQFSGSPSGTVPCVTEPEDGSLFPYNWTRPRIKWSGVTGLVQITVHADIEANDLVVYTAADHWIMDQTIWQNLAKHVHESDITVTVRAAGGGATTVKFQIASASAAGSIVFWAADPAAVNNQNVTTADDTSSYLRGFTVGEEGTVSTLKFSETKQPSRTQSWEKRSPTCIGCHSATPDPGFMAFIDNWPWNSLIAGVKPGIVGDELPGLTKGGLAALNKTWAGVATFSPQYWQTGKRIMVTTNSGIDEAAPWNTDNKQPAKLVWYDLDSQDPPPVQNVPQGPVAQEAAGNYGVIDRGSDTNGVAFPVWSHDGNTIIYSSTKGGNMDGRLQVGATDLYAVPFNGGKGGEAKPVPGAAESSWEEYYAAYSPDDQMVLFDRVASGQVMYANPSAEIFYVPLTGTPSAAKAVRLEANDPVKCSGASSPGINNHFPKWAPVAGAYNDRVYYWIVYSSNRAGYAPVVSKYDGKPHEISQLYLTAISVEKGIYKTYKSIYLWWQPTNTVNTTPVWDMITIPPAPPIL